MTLPTTTLRPGLLVSLKTSIVGNVSYKTWDTDTRNVGGNAVVSSWQTEKTVRDTAEQEAAVRAKSKARAYVTGVCAGSSFGLLCPENKIAQLDVAIANARQEADRFNASSKLTKLWVYIVCGTINPSDVEAVRAINSELLDLLEKMTAGTSNADPAVIRDAADRARSVSQMLTAPAQEAVGAAIKVARKVARKITKAKAEGQEAIEVDHEALAELQAARTAFLDLEVTQIEAQAAPEADRSLDLEPEGGEPGFQSDDDISEPLPQFEFGSD